MSASAGSHAFEDRRLDGDDSSLGVGLSRAALHREIDLKRGREGT
jgi:hypothetical protein